jgi:hypothetical protein
MSDEFPQKTSTALILRPVALKSQYSAYKTYEAICKKIYYVVQFTKNLKDIKNI